MSLTTGGNTYDAIHSGHGDITALTDASGNRVAMYTYDAWGNVLSSTGSVADLNPYRYGDYRYDSVSGLYDLNARYYDPSVGRFLSEDPTTYTPDYVYADNNPLTYLDPDGTWLLDVIFLASDLGTFISKPTWGAAAWVGLDILSTAIPIGSLSAVGHGIDYIKKTSQALRETKNIIKETDVALDAGRSVGKEEGHVENLASKGTPKLIKFKGDEAVQHFELHGNQVKDALGKSEYNLKNYLEDANHVLRNGQYVPERNAFVKLIGGKGSAKYGYVGLDRNTGNITTFHIKTAKHLSRIAPSLGIRIK